MAASLEPGEDYPRTMDDLQAWFDDEDACRAFLADLRWGNGFRCGACGHDECWTASDGRRICTRCETSCSITSGTIFDNTRTPLRTWFQAAWLAVSQKHGISANGLQQVLGLGSERTAWTLLHKLRGAMIRPGRDRLHGHVEVDETWVGGEESADEGIGRKTTGKAIVVIAVESMPHEPTFGRVRMRTVPNSRHSTLVRFIKWAIKPGSVVHTDAWSGYRGLPRHFYFHEIHNLSDDDAGRAVEELPAVHRVASLLKRWLLGTHHGAVSAEHLDRYLTEYTFRFNRRNADHRGLLFRRLLEYAVQTPPESYAELTA